MARYGVDLAPEVGFEELLSGLSGSQLDEFAIPEEGTLPHDELGILVTYLAEFTSTSDVCWFCYWDGFAFWEETDTPLRTRVEAENRSYFVFTGPLTAIGEFSESLLQSPNLWWPDDRSWCVATPIDAYSTYVGANSSCIDTVLKVPLLETLEVNEWSQIRR
ncbi:MAG: hypothetical protein ABR600_01145 [Actinomycetota bacterium]